MVCDLLFIKAAILR